ncbi:MAG: hypothetical protein KDA87_03825 [Planctomycetales bacterium]|nr:hypothetical protein [Planctomycetales bacterium]
MIFQEDVAVVSHFDIKWWRCRRTSGLQFLFNSLKKLGKGTKFVQRQRSLQRILVNKAKAANFLRIDFYDGTLIQRFENVARYLSERIRVLRIAVARLNF